MDAGAVATQHHWAPFPLQAGGCCHSAAAAGLRRSPAGSALLGGSRTPSHCWRGAGWGVCPYRSVFKAGASSHHRNSALCGAAPGRWLQQLRGQDTCFAGQQLIGTVWLELLASCSSTSCPSSGNACKPRMCRCGTRQVPRGAPIGPHLRPPAVGARVRPPCCGPSARRQDSSRPCAAPGACFPCSGGFPAAAA